MVVKRTIEQNIARLEEMAQEGRTWVMQLLAVAPEDRTQEWYDMYSEVEEYITNVGQNIDKIYLIIKESQKIEEDEGSLLQ